jgi:hypothetical protein
LLPKILRHNTRRRIAYLRTADLSGMAKFDRTNVPLKFLVSSLLLFVTFPL